MSSFLDESVQIEILTEVRDKSDGQTPIDINIQVDVRQYNYRTLEKQRCFTYFTKSPKSVDGTFTTKRINIGLKGLSDDGVKYLASLLEKRREKELREKEVYYTEQTVSKAEEANRLASCANCYSLLSLLVSLIALLLAVIGLFL